MKTKEGAYDGIQLWNILFENLKDYDQTALVVKVLSGF